jgi:prepilin-type processing-associated H-X9-DG protein
MREDTEPRNPEREGPRVVTLVVTVAILVIVAIGALLFPALARPGPRRVPSCSSNLKQWGVILKMYASEQRNGQYPPPAIEEGLYTPEPEALYHDYWSDPSIVVCTENPNQPSQDYPFYRNGMAAAAGSDYYYFGHLVTTEEEALTYILALPAAVDAGFPLDRALPVPEGKGAAGSSDFPPLYEDLDRDLAWRVPVMMDRDPNWHGGGCNVLFADGHVEFVEFGTFPVTEGILRALKTAEENF